MKVQGTVWSELDETKWYNSMDLESIDKLFSAYQKNGVSVSFENLDLHICTFINASGIIFIYSGFNH